jgi:uncharacterized repeat protein (TIGR03843 family)
VPEGQLHVVDAHDNHDRPVMLVHEDTAALRRMGLLDLVINNTDRKGGHVLAMPGGHRYGVDHGVCFHVDDKLRTVLWGWAGQAFDEAEVAGVERVAAALDEDLGEQLEQLLTVEEVRNTERRVRRLLSVGAFPDPGPGWPSLPWPPF